MFFEHLINPFRRNGVLQRQLDHNTGRCLFFQTALELLLTSNLHSYESLFVALEISSPGLGT